ncbi:porin [Myxococcaceae bacterium GXIMD 01537]
MRRASSQATALCLGLLTALPAGADDVIVMASEEGFSLSSADKAFQLRLRAQIAVDGHFFTSEEEMPGASTFAVRRARPILEGTLFSAFDFRLMPDFGSGTTVLQDAYIDARVLSGRLRVRAGKFKAPVGLERLQSVTATTFVERALPTDLVPNRDVGVQVHGELFGGVLAYAAGVFNGDPDGASSDTNLDDSFDLVERVFVQPFKPTSLEALQGLGLGFAVSNGQQFGNASETGVGVLRTPGLQTFFSYRTGDTLADTVIASGQHLRLSPQGYYYWGPVGLLAEYVSSAQEVRRGDARARLRNHSWQLMGSWVLFGGHPSFDGVRPEAPVEPSKDQWGAVEVAGRYTELTVDPDAFPVYADPTQSAREARSWGVGANWYLNRNTRLGANYERTTFEGGAVEGDRVPESVFLSRFQVFW